MSIICIDPQSDPLWQRLLDLHKSSVFHSPGWTRVLAHTYGLDVRAYVLLDETGEPRSGIPFCHISDMMGERIVALPFSDYCDPLVDERDWNCLIDKLLAERCQVTLRCLHNSVPLNDKRLALIDRAKWHGVDLQPDLDTIWSGLHSSARRAIKKARRDGVVVQIAQQKESLRAFFELHLRVRKYKYQLLAQPYSFFENIWHQFIEKQKGALLLATHDDQIIAGVLFLEWKNGLYYKFNASNPDAIAHRPNDLLLWEGIQYAKSQDLTHLDFGLSDWDQEGLVRYKRKYATEEKTISFLRYVPDEPPNDRIKQLRSLLPQLTDLFTDKSVPDHVTEQAGEVLYRFFT